jgi:hypothetical protein
MVYSTDPVENIRNPFRVLPSFPRFTLFSAFYPLFRVLPSFPRFTLFSRFYPLFRVLPSFPRFTLYSAFYPLFRDLPSIPRFTLYSAFYPLFRFRFSGSAIPIPPVRSVPFPRFTPTRFEQDYYKDDMFEGADVIFGERYG